MKSKGHYDVIILGSGIGGSMLGAILARHGVEVLLVEAGVHPRFAVGEATTPDTSCRFKLMALKYDVPEIANLATFHKLRHHVGASSGVKRAFSFLYHREGREQNPKESHQFPTLAPPLGPDCHLFRQDTDAYMLAVAAKYGADVRQRLRIKDVSIRERGVTLTSEQGEQFFCQYVADASGFHSPLARKFNLREDPATLSTNSRAIFTHMIQVPHYDAIGASPPEYELKYPLSQGTLHHVFEGGWLWVIPFNNHKDAVNPLCSVGLLLNRERYPETGMEAEEEFYLFVNRFPAMRRQFEHAKAVRNWVSTGRLQYCSKKTVGYRFCLLAHAAGFIDPLYSSGLNLTVANIDHLVKRLIPALGDGDFSERRFEEVDHQFQISLRHYDQVVAASFQAFPHFDLWDAWYRLWVVGNFTATALNTNLYFKYLNTKDSCWLNKSEDLPYRGVLGSTFEPQRDLFDRASQQMAAFQSGALSAHEAASNIRALYKDPPHLPGYYHWSDARVRTTPSFTVWQATRLFNWYFWNMPREMKKQIFDWSMLKAYAYIFKGIRESGFLARRVKRHYLRDTFMSWNRDWQEKTGPSSESPTGKQGGTRNTSSSMKPREGTSSA